MNHTRQRARWSGGGFEGDVVAHGFELGDEAALAGGAVAALVEVVAAEVVVGLAGGEQVPGDHEDRVADRDGGALGSAPAADLRVLGGEVGVLGAAGGLAGFDEGLAEPLRAVTGPARSGACRRTRCCRGTCPPTTRGARRSGSGTCRRRSQRGSPGRCVEPRPGSSPATSPPLRKGPTAHRCASPSVVDGGVGLVDAGQHRPAQQRVVLVEPAGHARPAAAGSWSASGPWPSRRAPRGRVDRR